METNGSDGEAWEAMGDRTRQAVLGELAERPSALGELADRLPISRPANKVLKVLKDTGLVSDESHATRRIYRLNSTGVQALRDQLDTFWNRAMANYEQLVDEAALDAPEEET